MSDYELSVLLYKVRMKVGTRIAGICFTGVCLGFLWWVWAFGDFAAGSWNIEAWSIIIGLPLACLWLLYASFVLTKISRSWFLMVAIGTSVLTVPLMFQPWNPRVQFVTKLKSLEGMAVSRAQEVMSEYFGGEVSPVEGEHVPPDLGITHSMSYRWNETDWQYNADVGTAYVAGDKVVATEFSPD